MAHLRIAFVLFNNVTQLDLTGPVQVLSRMGDATINLVAHTCDAIMTDAGFSINPTCTFDNCKKPDIVCVPGGAGADDAMLDPVLIDWLRDAAKEAQWVTSVCAGSLVLGAAGLLKGKRATSHWLSRDMLVEFGAIPDSSRVVIDGRVITGGGVTAGIDFALTLIAKVRGEHQAKLVQLALEYDPEPPFGSGSPERAELDILNDIRRLTERHQTERLVKVRKAAASLD